MFVDIFLVLCKLLVRLFQKEMMPLFLERNSMTTYWNQMKIVIKLIIRILHCHYSNSLSAYRAKKSRHPMGTLKKLIRLHMPCSKELGPSFKIIYLSWDQVLNFWNLIRFEILKYRGVILNSIAWPWVHLLVENGGTRTVYTNNPNLFL